MAIYIKGVTMPKCCADCDPDFGIAIGCDKWKNGKFNFIKERPNDCPLVYIPEPHGRLIDADDVKLQKELFTYKRDAFIDEAPFETADKELDNAPTVIEGSE